MIRNRILEILNERGKIEFKELVKELKTHPYVVRKIVEELRREGKINLTKEVYHHKPKKFKLFVSL
ncbi:NEQ304 [Nanoarchaeum equitans Kin4-M]|uniref:NEQ304 n=1 Tax=Nanoarchaeum equitans (strain Kin4-M) TaxID=228908 RepID=Q74MU3_NANEQ|nr:NEQ304 [Nanoarchaeum equitans Kin4-M]